MSVAAILAFIQGIIPTLTSSAAIAKVVDFLVDWLPTIITVAKSEVDVVKEIIQDLTDHSATDDEQLARIQKLNADTDALWAKAMASRGLNPDGTPINSGSAG